MRHVSSIQVTKVSVEGSGAGRAELGGARRPSLLLLSALGIGVLSAGCSAGGDDPVAGAEGGAAGAAASGAGSEVRVVLATGGHASSDASAQVHDTTAGQAGAGAVGDAACPSGYADCDRDPANGCETLTSIDPRNCGACEVACSTDHAHAACENGSCQVTCEEGFGDCNRDVKDGCETDTLTSVDDCGACGQGCDLANAEAQACLSGACEIVTCLEGFVDCNGIASDGCEADLDSDARNCGWCGHSCGSQSCQSSACRAGVQESGYFTNLPTRLVRHGTSFYAMLGGSANSLWKTGPGAWAIFWSGVGIDGVPESLAADADRLYWASESGYIFRADAARPDGWVIADRASAPGMLSVSGDRMIWVEGTSVVRLADADAQVQKTLNTHVSDVLAFPGGYFYASGDTVYRIAAETMAWGTSLGVAMLAYDARGELVYWTARSHSDRGTIRNGAFPDQRVDLPTSGIRDLIVHDGFAYWTTENGSLYRVNPYLTNYEIQRVATSSKALSGPAVADSSIYWLCGAALCRTPIPD